MAFFNVNIYLFCDIYSNSIDYSGISYYLHVFSFHPVDDQVKFRFPWRIFLKRVRISTLSERLGSSNNL